MRSQGNQALWPPFASSIGKRFKAECLLASALDWPPVTQDCSDFGGHTFKATLRAEGVKFPVPAGLVVPQAVPVSQYGLYNVLPGKHGVTLASMSSGPWCYATGSSRSPQRGRESALA